MSSFYFIFPPPPPSSLKHPIFKPQEKRKKNSTRRVRKKEEKSVSAHLPKYSNTSSKIYTPHKGLKIKNKKSNYSQNNPQCKHRLTKETESAEEPVTVIQPLSSPIPTNNFPSFQT